MHAVLNILNSNTSMGIYFEANVNYLERCAIEFYPVINIRINFHAF